MHDFQALGAAARFAEAADARAARQTLLLLRREVEKSQRQKAGTVGDLAQHLPPAAKDDLRQQHFALHRRALPGAQLAQRHHARAIFVTQRQQKQQILGGLTPRARSRRASASPTPRNTVTGLGLDHRATMHSTSIWAPRGSAATPTVDRAG